MQYDVEVTDCFVLISKLLRQRQRLKSRMKRQCLSYKRYPLCSLSKNGWLLYCMRLVQEFPRQGGATWGLLGFEGGS